MLLSGPGTCQGSARARLGTISPSPGDLALNQALGGASLSKGSSAHLFSIPAAFPGTLRAGKALERFSNLTDPRILWLLCSARRVCEDRGGRQGSIIFIGIFFFLFPDKTPLSPQLQWFWCSAPADSTIHLPKSSGIAEGFKPKFPRSFNGLQGKFAQAQPRIKQICPALSRCEQSCQPGCIHHHPAESSNTALTWGKGEKGN